MVWTSLFHLYTSSFNLLSLHFFFHRDSQRIRLQGWQVSLISLFLLLEMLGSSLFPLVISGVLNLILSFSTTYLMGRIYGYSKTSSLFWACIFQEASIFIESSLAFLLFQVWGLPPIQTLPSVFLYTSLLIGLGFLLVFSLRKFVLVKLPDIELRRMTRLKILLIPIISSLAIFLDLLGRLYPQLQTRFQSSYLLFLLLIGITSVLLYQDLLSEIKKQEEANIGRIRAEHQVGIVEEQYQRQESIRALHHDWKNQLLVLHALLAEQQYQEAIDQLEGHMDWLDHAGRQYSTDPVLNFLLQQKADEASQHGASLEISISLQPYRALDPQITAVILGNLLDNALHALETLSPQQDKWIRCDIRVEQNRLSIHTSNPYNPAKPAKSGQGLGIPNIEAVVQSYHGLYQGRGDGQLYQSHILLPITNTNPAVW